MIRFAWDDWNIDHIAEHGVTREEAEFVVRHASPPFPREIEDEKNAVWGQTEQGRYLQVIFVYRSEDEVDYESLTLKEVLAIAEDRTTFVYVVHSMEMTDRMKRQYRRL